MNKFSCATPFYLPRLTMRTRAATGMVTTITAQRFPPRKKAT
jgi:hypothetical protein